MPSTPTRTPRRNVFHRICEARLEDFASQRPLRTGSLLISLFGDAIAPHGGEVWLGSLIDVLARFGVNQRLVRTTVFRLSKDGWLCAEQVGRRSFYRLDNTGHSRVTAASERIYAAPTTQPTADWCIALLTGVEGTRRDEIRRELTWLGFAPLSPSVMLHPGLRQQRVDRALTGLPGQAQVITLRATADASSTDALRTQVIAAFDIDALTSRYRQFTERFAPALTAAKRVRRLEPGDAFVLRTLLIHEYRKIVLRDPLLPASMLPSPWHGQKAYHLCRDLYRTLDEPARAYLDEHFETRAGKWPRANAEFFRRFGGLGRD
ncbi:MAG: phenylacetic acid degradation operon negative regulatory protein PaaX [Gammaproteobacteria bacterium]